MKTNNKDIQQIFALLSELKENQKKLQSSLVKGFDTANKITNITRFKN